MKLFVLYTPELINIKRTLSVLKVTLNIEIKIKVFNI